jgi:hypothetical protein
MVENTTPFWTTQENQMAPSFLPLTSFDSLGIQFLHKEEVLHQSPTLK